MQISKEVIEILEYLCEKIGITIDWTSNNILPYVQQLAEKYIAWEISTSVAWIAIAVIIFISSLVFTLIVHKTCSWDGIEWVVLVICFIVSTIVIGVQTFDIIECKTFPEKSLYEYIQYNITTRDLRGR